MREFLIPACLSFLFPNWVWLVGSLFSFLPFFGFSFPFLSTFVLMSEVFCFVSVFWF